MATQGANYGYKHILIVHGIGDQVPNETSLTFMNNFLRALPEEGVRVDNLIQSVDPPAEAAGAAARFSPAFVEYPCGRGACIIGFSEVYWQDITNGYLRKGKPPIPIFVWAHSINTRLRRHGRPFHIAREAIDNLEKLLGLVKLLALVYKKSDTLYRVLNRFLGDVQMYAESDDIRARIDRRFADVAAQVQLIEAKLRTKYGLSDGAEIYVVAHSEGTVVSYASLVNAARRKEPWLEQVRGLVTLGSPIDKHYSIWDNRFQTQTYDGPASEKPIPWFNYWDVSDPVGYGLKELQERSESRPEQPTDTEKLFDIRYDKPFVRYPIPGLAHVEYWTDAELQRHIIHNVLDLDKTPAPMPGTDVEPLPDRWFGAPGVQTIGEGLAYALGRLGTIAAGIYFLAHAAVRLPESWKPTAFQAAPVTNSVLMLAPLAVCVILWRIYGVLRGRSATAVLLARRIVWLVWLVFAVRFALSVSRDFAADPMPEIKDMAGYAAGLGMSAAAWALHTMVHKGIVQMWHYTKGRDSASVPRDRAVATYNGH